MPDDGRSWPVLPLQGCVSGTLGGWVGVGGWLVCVLSGVWQCAALLGAVTSSRAEASNNTEHAPMRWHLQCMLHPPQAALHTRATTIACVPIS
jgi:hypothetical protein